jgi:predicted nucleotidyltransferase component of viral defense system
MIDWPWRSPEATRRALADRVAARYPAEERGRRLHEIAYRRLLRRLFEAQPERWVVKGGAGLLLRLDPNRTSNDIDLTYVAEAGEYAVVLSALRDAAATDLGDFFTFEVLAGREVDAAHPLERALSVPVVARIGNREFARFSLDLVLPRNDVEPEWISAETSLTGVAAVDEIPRVATLPFAAQLAEKVCAIYERHGEGENHSTRARDLADIAMIAMQVDLAGKELHERTRSEERRRRDAGTLLEPLPDALVLSDAQRDDWRRRWSKATRDAPIEFDEALDFAAALMNPVLADSVENQRWHAASRQWEVANAGF